MPLNQALKRRHSWWRGCKNTHFVFKCKVCDSAALNTDREHLLESRPCCFLGTRTWLKTYSAWWSLSLWFVFWILTFDSLLYCCSVAESCPTLCDPVDCSAPGFPVLHCLPGFTQTCVHCVGDAIQPSHLVLWRPLLLLPSIFPSIRSFPVSQLFASGGLYYV